MRLWGIVVIIVISLIVVPTYALHLEVSTTVPEYVMENYMNINGTVSPSHSNWTETLDSDFQNGSVTNLSIVDDSLLLKPGLDFQILNDGKAVITSGPSGAWDSNLYKGTSLLLFKGTYYFYYSASATNTSYMYRQIGVATSVDFVNWTKSPYNPVISIAVDSYDYKRAMLPCVIQDGNMLKMWYTGTSNASNDDICYAYSSDGINWTKNSVNPVLSRGPSGSWDAEAAWPWTVTKDDNGIYWMYYRAEKSTNPAMGLANSTNGINWTKHPKNPLRAYSNVFGWENRYFWFNPLEKSNGTYRFWSIAGAGAPSVGYATSSDGLSWIDSGGPVLRPKAGTIYSNVLQGFTAVDRGDHYLSMIACYSGGSSTPVIGAFRIEPNKLIGRYLSDILDVGGIVELNNITWDTKLSPGGDLRIYVRWGNDTSNLTQWKQVDDLASIEGVIARYIQYRADLSAYKDWFTVRLKRVTVNYTAPVDRVEVRVDDGAWQNTTLNQGEWHMNQTLTDGDHLLTIRATDSTGDEVEKVIAVRVDLFLPEGNITLEDGNSVTNSTTIAYSLMAEDTHGVPQQMISFRSDFNGSVWESYNPVGELEYGGSDGIVTVFAKFMDGAGRISDVTSDSIIVDTTPPDGDLVIDNGTIFTNDPEVSLNIVWSDLSEVVQMMVSNDPAFAGATWQTPASTLHWSLVETDGRHTVYLRLRDGAGWITDVSDDIILDMKDPTGALSINEDDSFTSTRDVNLDITFHDMSPVSIQLVNGRDTWPGVWRELTSPSNISWELASGEDGPREVKMLVRDAAGNEAIFTDDIVLDTTPPDIDLTLADGDSFIYDLLVNVHLLATDTTSGVTMMRLSNTGDFSSVDWSEYSEESTWQFPVGEGVKTLFVQVIDKAGLIATLDSSVIMDTTSPEGTFKINNGDTYTRSSEVTLDLDFEDDFGLDIVRVSASQSFDEAEWTMYKSSLIWNLALEGRNVIFLEVRDEAGNIASTNSSIMYDATPPRIEFLSPTEEMTKEDNVMVEVSVVDSIDETPAVEWRVDEGIWQTLVESSFDLILTEGVHVIEMKAIDKAGNLASNNASIVFDGTPPVVVFVSPTKKATTKDRVTVEVSVTDAIDGSPAVEWRLDEGTWEALLGTTFRVKLDDGKHTVEVRAVDAAGNEVVEELRIEKEPESSNTSGPFLWIVIIIIIVIVAIGYWQWRLRSSNE